MKTWSPALETLKNVVLQLPNPDWGRLMVGSLKGQPLSTDHAQRRVERDEDAEVRVGCEAIAHGQHDSAAAKHLRLTDPKHESAAPVRFER